MAQLNHIYFKRQVVRYKVSNAKSCLLWHSETIWLPTEKECKNIGSPLWGLPPQLAKRPVHVLAERQPLLAPITVTCVSSFFLPPNFYINCRRHTHPTHTHSKHLKKNRGKRRCQSDMGCCCRKCVCLYCTQRIGGGGWKCQANMI